ncbi:hypothetical protein VUR80DRAFT_4227 [Thermomyces stellatus]
MENQGQQQAQAGSLSWRLSSHPVTLLTFLGFRIASFLFYLLGLLIIGNMILTFIITMLLLAADFYYTKNIAGRRLVGLRWWNEVDASGNSRWVFESSEPGTRVVNATDSRFFWLAMYVQPVVWVVMAILAFVRLQFLWVPLVAIALILTVMNTLAFSRCDKFSQASNMAGSAFSGGRLAGNLASGMVGRWFSGW